MESKLRAICAGFIWSVLFGTAGGMVGGGLTFGLFGVVAGMIDQGPLHAIGGAVFFGILGAYVGSMLGLASGAIGWLPTVLFRESPRMSYVAALLLGTVVGIFACYLHATSPNTIGGLGAVNAALLMMSGITGSLAANFILRRWVICVPERYEF